MVQSRGAVVTILFCVVSWFALSLAGLNADFKTEVQAAPLGNGYVPTYWEFLGMQGFKLLPYFLPYHPNPIGWLILIWGACAFFLPAFAAYLAAHTSVRWLCVMTAAGFTYLSLEVLFSFPAADRNGCEVCDNVGSFQVLVGGVLLLIAAGSRVLDRRKRRRAATA
jgi:hypothetical protein